MYSDNFLPHILSPFRSYHHHLPPVPFPDHDFWFCFVIHVILAGPFLWALGGAWCGPQWVSDWKQWFPVSPPPPTVNSSAGGVGPQEPLLHPHLTASRPPPVPARPPGIQSCCVFPELAISQPFSMSFDFYILSTPSSNMFLAFWRDSIKVLLGIGSCLSFIPRASCFLLLWFDS